MDNIFEYQLSIAVIIKDEAPYIEEWLNYHFLAGVEHVYLYDNDSSDNLKEILKPYIDAGVLEYNYYPGQYRQLEAYDDAIRRHKFDTKYLAVIDVDDSNFAHGKHPVCLDKSA